MKNSRILSWRIIFVGLITMCELAVAEEAAKPKVPEPFILMYGHSDDDGVDEEFKELLPRFTALEGTSRDALFIKNVRDLGVVYAAHVVNPVAATEEQLVEIWSAPFNDTLGGELPDGYEAIAIDELRDNPNGTEQSRRVCGALQAVRKAFPKKLIFAAATWHLGHPGHSARNSEQLQAVNKYADILMLESYQREAHFAYRNLRNYAAQIHSYSGLIEKTVIGLGIAQDGRVSGGGHLFDDSSEKGFLGCLDYQLHTIRNDPIASRMPGVMFWTYYRAEIHITPDFVARLCERVKEWVHQRGGKLMYLGGNGVNCEVEFESEDGLRFKTHFPLSSDAATKNFNSGDPQNHFESRLHRTLESEANLLGVVCTETGIMTAAPCRVVDAEHWVFAGTGLSQGDLFGETRLQERVHGGASGHETDKMSPHSPPGTALLAKGFNCDDGGAEMVYYEAAGGGAVFSVGSITYVPCLLVDNAISRVTANVVARFLADS